MAEGSVTTTGSRRGTLSLWIQSHDDSWLFIGAYVTLAVVLSIAISLFWLVVLVAVHLVLEWHAHSARFGKRTPLVASESLWSVLLDIGLVVFALVLAVYMDVIFGVLGLGAAARAGAQVAGRVGSRAAGWQTALRGVLLSADDAVHIGRTVIGRTRDEENAAAVLTSEPQSSWRRRWSRGERLTVGFTIVCAALLVASPWLLDYSIAEVLAILADELRPLP